MPQVIIFHDRKIYSWSIRIRTVISRDLPWPRHCRPSHLERMAFLTSRLRNPADRESQEKPRIDGVREEDGHYGAEARRINSTKNGSKGRNLLYFVYLFSSILLSFLLIDTTYKLIMNDPIENFFLLHSSPIDLCWYDFSTSSSFFPPLFLTKLRCYVNNY